MALFPSKMIFAYLDFGTLFHYERQRNRGGRNGTDFRGNGCELVAVRGQQFLNDNFSALYFGRIVLTLLGKSDLSFLELIEDVALRDGAQAYILDFADGWLFLDVDMDDPALGGGLALNSQIVKIASVPERVKVAFQGGLVVNVTGLGEHAGADGLSRNSAIALDLDGLDHALLRHAGAGKEKESEKDTDRRGTAAGPADEQDRGSYLKMARNDETSVQVNESAIIRYGCTGSETCRPACMRRMGTLTLAGRGSFGNSLDLDESGVEGSTTT